MSNVVDFYVYREVRLQVDPELYEKNYNQVVLEAQCGYFPTHITPREVIMIAAERSLIDEANLHTIVMEFKVV